MTNNCSIEDQIILPDSKFLISGQSTFKSERKKLNEWHGLLSRPGWSGCVRLNTTMLVVPDTDTEIGSACVYIAQFVARCISRCK